MFFFLFCFGSVFSMSISDLEMSLEKRDVPAVLGLE